MRHAARGLHVTGINYVDIRSLAGLITCRVTGWFFGQWYWSVDFTADLSKSQNRVPLVP